LIGPTWLETFEDLHRASTVAELWSVLLSWHGMRSSTQWEEPYVLFRRFHAAEPEGAIVTAALLCTDHRWRKAIHHLIVRIVESGVLTRADEQQIAEWFVAGDGFAVEAEVFDRQQLSGTCDEHGVVVVKRPVWPPLRRWAAARLIVGDPSRWRSLLDAVAMMPARDAAALTAGIMDAAAYIPREEGPTAVAIGLDSGSGIVRLAALPGLAALEGNDAALARAAVDPSAHVRAWRPTAESDGDPAARKAPEIAGSPTTEPARRDTLF
jgi:hypothetical protein